MGDEDLPVVTAEQRRDDRMSGVPDIYKAPLERMACELALELEDPTEVFRRYGYAEDRAAALLNSEQFSILLARIGKEVRESGLSFKMKARAMAEGFLADVYDIVTDPLQPTSERGKLIQWTAKVGGLEPKEKDEGKVPGGFALSITFAGEQQPMKVVGNEPVTIEQQ